LPPAFQNLDLKDIYYKEKSWTWVHYY